MVYLRFAARAAEFYRHSIFFTILSSAIMTLLFHDVRRCGRYFMLPGDDCFARLISALFLSMILILHRPIFFTYTRYRMLRFYRLALMGDAIARWFSSTLH